MSKPINLRVLDAVIDRLQAIRIANGYQTDVGLRVFHANRAPDATLPLIVVWEGAEDVTKRGVRKHDLTLAISVEGLVEADQDCTGRDLASLKADIKKALFDYRGGLSEGGENIASLTYAGATPLPRADGADCECVVVNASASYTEGIGDPYANSQ